MTEGTRSEVTGPAAVWSDGVLRALVAYSPDQPRDPAGSATGGQWSADGSDQSAASDDEEAKALYAQLLNMPPEQRDKFLAGLNNDQLTRLGKFASLGKATNGPIADIRNKTGQALKSRGINPGSAGLKEKGGKKGAGKKGGSGKSGGGGSKGGGSKGGGKSGGSSKKSGGGSKSSGGGSSKKESSGSSSKSSGSKSSSSKTSGTKTTTTKTAKPKPAPPPPPKLTPIGGPGLRDVPRGPGSPGRPVPQPAKAGHRHRKALRSSADPSATAAVLEAWRTGTAGPP